VNQGTHAPDHRTRKNSQRRKGKGRGQPQTSRGRPPPAPGNQKKKPSSLAPDVKGRNKGKGVQRPRGGWGARPFPRNPRLTARKSWDTPGNQLAPGDKFSFNLGFNPVNGPRPRRAKKFKEPDLLEPKPTKGDQPIRLTHREQG